MSETWSAWQLKNANGELVDYYTKKGGANEIRDSHGCLYTLGKYIIQWADTPHPQLVEDTTGWSFNYKIEKDYQPDYLRDIFMQHIFNK